MKKKNQHYVPQFHLRQWSLDGKLVSLYNKKRQLFVDNKASIKNIASENYLYDKDGTMENLFSKLEAYIAPICKKIIESESLENLTYEELDALYFHIIMCNERTAAAGEDHEELIKTIVETSMKMYHAHGRHLNIDADTIRDKFTVQFPCNIAIKNAFKYYPLIKDLKISLIKNSSNVEFLTSDYPTIKYNLWSLTRKLYSGWGMSSVGIMYILPISPRFALIAYDPVVYNIKNLVKNKVLISKHSQINEINKLMILNANQNLFFSPNITSHYINRILSSISKHITPPRPVTVLGNTNSFLIANSTRRVLYRADLSFLTMLPESLKWYVPRHSAGLSRPTSEDIAKALDIKLDKEYSS